MVKLFSVHDIDVYVSKEQKCLLNREEVYAAQKFLELMYKKMMGRSRHTDKEIVTGVPIDYSRHLFLVCYIDGKNHTAYLQIYDNVQKTFASDLTYDELKNLNNALEKLVIRTDNWLAQGREQDAELLKEFRKRAKELEAIRNREPAERVKRIDTQVIKCPLNISGRLSTLMKNANIPVKVVEYNKEAKAYIYYPAPAKEKLDEILAALRRAHELSKSREQEKPPEERQYNAKDTRELLSTPLNNRFNDAKEESEATKTADTDKEPRVKEKSKEWQRE